MLKESLLCYTAIMGRQEKKRAVGVPPRSFKFRAEETPTDEGKKIQLRFDEFEALRLADHLGYEHAEAAAVMGVSRPTFTRLLKRSRKKTADFFVNGRELEVYGGSVLFSDDVYCCRNCRIPFRWESADPPVCSRCGKNDVLLPRKDCDHDCRCCDDQGE